MQLDTYVVQVLRMLEGLKQSKTLDMSDYYGVQSNYVQSKERLIAPKF